MGKDSHIEWTDHTFNGWIGCTKVSDGCAHCYAENLMDTRMHVVSWGKGNPRKHTTEANWNEPIKWNREASAMADVDEHKRLVGQPPVYGRRTRVFSASLSDWLDHEVPIEWLAQLLDLIRKTPCLDWQLLTKRPQNWKDRLDNVLDWEPLPKEDDPLHHLSDWILDWYNDKPPANVWIGTSVENQECADERIPELLKIPARVRFLSCEPLLGPVELDDVPLDDRCFGPWEGPKDNPLPGIRWVICGGESGHNARPMHPAWARSLRDQCKAADVPFLFKQWGEWVTELQSPNDIILPGESTAFWSKLNKDTNEYDLGDQTTVYKVGKKAAGRLLDGIEHNEFPEVTP